MILALIHLGSCLYLTGLIWTVQIVHYPSFLYVGQDKFEAFNVFHQKAMTYIVAPVMILELLTGLLICFNDVSSIKNWFLFSLIILIWVSTFVLSVPIHSKLLSQGYDVYTIQQLGTTN